MNAQEQAYIQQSLLDMYNAAYLANGRVNPSTEAPVSNPHVSADTGVIEMKLRIVDGRRHYAIDNADRDE